MLALRLNTVISSIIHPDQSGFIPDRSTAINLHRLFLNIQSQADNVGDGALFSLDAYKAFDSIEWQYLWPTMQKFGFGPIFRSWLQMLYSSPKVLISEAGHVSTPFPLHRGTRQGCSLSPLLFAIAIEPMVASIRLNPIITGFKYGQIH